MDQDKARCFKTYLLEQHPFKKITMRSGDIASHRQSLEAFINELATSDSCFNLNNRSFTKCKCCHSLLSSNEATDALLSYRNKSPHDQVKFIREVAESRQGKRGKVKGWYRIGERFTVCSNTFMNLYGYQYDSFNRLINNTAIKPRKMSAQSEAEQSIVEYITNIKDDDGEIDDDTGYIYLSPCKFTYRKVYESWAYQRGWEPTKSFPDTACDFRKRSNLDSEQQEGICSWRSFNRIWKTHFPLLVIPDYTPEQMEQVMEEHKRGREERKEIRNQNAEFRESQQIKWNGYMHRRYQRDKALMLAFTHARFNGEISQDVITALLNSGRLKQIQARDLYRIREFENRFGIQAFSISKDHASGIVFSKRSFKVNFNSPSGVIEEFNKYSTEQRQPQLQFKYVIIDYVWLPPGWLYQVMTLSFFKMLVAINDFLQDDVQIILPFHSDVLARLADKDTDKEGTGYQILTDDKRGGCYKIRYSKDVSENPLCVATNALYVKKKDSTQWFQDKLGKGPNQEEIFCTVQASQRSKEWENAIPNLPPKTGFAAYRWIILEKDSSLLGRMASKRSDKHDV